MANICIPCSCEYTSKARLVKHLAKKGGDAYHSWPGHAVTSKLEAARRLRKEFALSRVVPSQVDPSTPGLPQSLLFGYRILPEDIDAMAKHIDELHEVIHWVPSGSLVFVDALQSRQTDWFPVPPKE